MKLYDAVWAPSPRRVRMFLSEKGLKLERILLDLRADEHLAADYLAINPRGTVPALLLDDGEIIVESSAICRFLEAIHPDPPLFGANPRDIARVEAALRLVDGEGYAAAVYAFRNRHPAFAGRGLPGNWPTTAQIPALVDRAQAMWTRFLDSLDSRLRDHPWVACDRLSHADIAAFVTLEFGVAAKLDAGEEHPALVAWRDKMRARPSAAA